MYTSIVLFAFAGFSSTAENVVAPSWLTDYPQARKQGAMEKKPLAVFVGNGEGGFHKLSQEGQLNNTIKKTLANHYVCVYLDSGSQSQQALIKALAITKGQGLVLSDRTGGLQAFHHDGTLSTAELSKQLSHFAASEVEVRTTITNVNQRVSYYPDISAGRQGINGSGATVRC